MKVPFYIRCLSLYAQDVTYFQVVPKQFFQDADIHGGCHSHTVGFSIFSTETVLRGSGRSGNIVSPIREQEPKIELYGFLDHRICPVFQEIQVFCIAVMFPEMPAEPSGTHGPHGIGTGILILPEISNRSGVSPDIQVVVAHPSGKSIDLPGCLPSILCCPADQVKERSLHSPRLHLSAIQ